MALSLEVLQAALPGIRRRLEGAKTDAPGITEITKKAYRGFYRDDVAVLLEALESGLKLPAEKEEKKPEPPKVETPKAQSEKRPEPQKAKVPSV